MSRTFLHFQLAILAVLLVSAAGISQAGIQIRQSVCWLGTDGWQLRVNGEEGVYLVECPPERLDRSRRAPSDASHRWHVSAPTIKTQSGKFLASDPQGRAPTVHIVSDQGANTRWAFDFVSRVEPTRTGGRRGSYLEGPSSLTFRVQLAEGPFQGWYLAAEAIEAGRKERPLKLVRDAKEATVFRYVESYNWYKSNHKT